MVTYHESHPLASAADAHKKASAWEAFLLTTSVLVLGTQ